MEGSSPRCGAGSGGSLRVTDAAKEWLALNGFDPVYGARPLRRLVQSAIGDQLARALLSGDVVLGRKDTGVAYHLAVTHDDALQGVTDIVRGQDLFEATHIQRLIQTLMGWPEPRYRHHPLLTDASGRRYAKRDRSVTLAELRSGGMSAAALRAELGFSSAG